MTYVCVPADCRDSRERFSIWIAGEMLANRHNSALSTEACKVAQLLFKVSAEHHFARALKVYPAEILATGNMESIHTQWWRTLGGSNSSRFNDQADSLDAFLGCLATVTCPYARSALDEALKVAGADTRPLPPKIPERYARLYRLACALSADGSKNFFIDPSRIVSFVGVDERQGARWVNALIGCGAFAVVRGFRRPKDGKPGVGRRFELRILPTPSQPPHPR